MASALYAGTAPMVGSTKLLKIDIKMPPTAARAEPMKKLRYRTFMVLIPQDVAI
jgi:hypothetical protein